MRAEFRRLTLFLTILACDVSAADLTSLPALKNYTQERVTSSDPTGGNDDGNWKNPIKPEEERKIADLTGPGIITHMWFTIATPEPYHLKKIVLRAYWDNDIDPAIETPIGDFFGLGLGQYFLYESSPIFRGFAKGPELLFSDAIPQSSPYHYHE